MKQDEELYRDLVENSRDLMCTHDLGGKLLTVNLAAARTLGYEPEELVNRNLRDLLSPAIHKDLDAYLTALREKHSATGFIELWSKNGQRRFWKYACTLRTEGVEVPFVRGMAHDLTDLLQAQRELRDSEQRLRIAAEVGRMYAWEWNPATDEVRRSAECEEILGIDDSAGGAVAKDYFPLIHPDDREVLWRLANSLTPQNPSYRTEYRRYRPDGSLLWLGESGRGTFDAAGKMIRLFGMTADITERKRIEEKLRASEARNREIVQKSPVAMLIEHGTENRNDFVNERFTKLFGYTQEDIPTVDSWWPLAYPDEAYREAIRTEWKSRVAVAIAEHAEIAPMEAWVRSKDGSYRYVEFHFAPLGEINLVSFVDLTARKNAEDELAKVGGRLIDAHEEERTRISIDLHEDICQRLALLKIELGSLAGAPGDERNGVRKEIDKLQENAAGILKDVRAISYELHPPVLELLSLSAALRSLFWEFSQSHKVKIDFTEKDVPTDLPKDISICLFRIAEEALRNAAKYSGAGNFQVQLAGVEGAVRLTIRDAGVGFDPGAAMKAGGLGLISMRERITMVNGTLTIRSKPHEGTEIVCSVPFETKTAQHA